MSRPPDEHADREVWKVTIDTTAVRVIVLVDDASAAVTLAD